MGFVSCACGVSCVCILAKRDFEAGGVCRQLQAEIEHTNKISQDRELLCVLAVIRHGDRTPKHKLKLSVRPPCRSLLSPSISSRGQTFRLLLLLEAISEACLGGLRRLQSSRAVLLSCRCRISRSWTCLVSTRTARAARRS